MSMTHAERVWAAALNTLRLSWVAPERSLVVRGEEIPYSFLLDIGSTYVVIEERDTRYYPANEVGVFATLGLTVLVGNVDGDIRYLSHPSLTKGGPAFLMHCSECKAFFFSPDSESVCRACGEIDTGTKDIQTVLMNSWAIVRMAEWESYKTQQELSRDVPSSIQAPSSEEEPPLLDAKMAERADIHGINTRGRLKATLLKSPRAHLWPMPDKIAELIKRYPNFHEVGDLLLHEAFLAQSRKKSFVRMPRILLVGSPSCGKSSFVDELAKLLVENDWAHLNFGHQVPYFALVGSDEQFRDAKEGKILQLLTGVSSPIRNPMLILDEVDKIIGKSRWDPLPALLSLIDEREAKSFTDEYLGTPVDASGMLVVAIANDRYAIPEPLRSRFVEFHIRDYTPHELIEIVVPETYRRWKEDFRDGIYPDELSRETCERIVELAEGIPRQFGRVIGRLAATGYRELFQRPTFDSISEGGIYDNK